MERSRIRKLLAGRFLPIAAAAVCLVSIGLLALWFFLGKDRTGEDASNDTARTISAAQGSVAPLTGFDDRGEAISQGWGFVAFSDNIVVTTFHAIDYCSKITLSDSDPAGSVRVLAYDTEQDFAVLKLSKSPGATALACGSSEGLRTGDILFAMGDAGREVSFAGRSQARLLISFSGSSLPPGSPLLDKSGQVVGMITGSAENGLAAAVPIESIRALFLSSQAESTLGSLCTTLHPGLKYLRGSTAATFSELVRDPERYEGQCVRLVGRAVYTEEYTATARQNLIFLMMPGSVVPDKEPTISPWEGAHMDGYYPYWFFTSFSESRLLRCIDGTHTVKTARYQGEDVLVCGNFHCEPDYGYATLELLYTDTPQALEILGLPDP